MQQVPMNKLLFHLLHAIHRQRKQRTVAILIHNLYKPILWRYLEASNGLVMNLCLGSIIYPIIENCLLPFEYRLEQTRYVCFLTLSRLRVAKELRKMRLFVTSSGKLCYLLLWIPFPLFE